jgi:hypothetical protein
MPIRPELCHFYGPNWQRVMRPRILRRAGGLFDVNGRYLGGARCERCGVLDREVVMRSGGWWYHKNSRRWCRPDGLISEATKDEIPDKPCRHVRVVITIAHVNHQPGEDRDENLFAGCQWCHLNHDRSEHLAHSAVTRATHKDIRRPLLRQAMNELEPQRVSLSAICRAYRDVTQGVQAEAS